MKVVKIVFVGTSEWKIYTLIWWAEMRERCIQCVGGQK